MNLGELVGMQRAWQLGEARRARELEWNRVARDREQRRRLVARYRHESVGGQSRDGRP